MLLEVADYMIGSPTALASQDVETSLRSGAKAHGLYVPAGAFWGAEDIMKMADEGTLKVSSYSFCFNKYSCTYWVFF